ncbi:hypothetical protein SteCoe_19991 [Stentor coeruleus]|uniref:COPI associated protein n=1 Tax=Stentor coeruleus TaxID=5963 RepID=A0A1R2BT29_9CILI|nr:hypothetical protein SteCoe_19991 [Stentor coeruleus]
MAQETDRFVWILRILTFSSGIALIILAILKFITFSIGSARDFFLTIYYIFFGILICLSEMPCKRLMSCFYFLKFYIGKALFFLFLGTITFTWTPIFYLIISIIMFLASGFYFFLFLSCSRKENEQPKGEKQEPAKFEKREVENEA